MSFSEEQLAEVTRLAAAAYSPSQVAFMLGIRPSEFKPLLQDENSDVAIAYFKGLYSSELSIRESILLLARNGSSPAQTSSLQLFTHVRKELVKGGYPGLTEDEE